MSFIHMLIYKITNVHELMNEVLKLHTIGYSSSFYFWAIVLQEVHIFFNVWMLVEIEN